MNRGKILIIEDDPAILAGLREKLTLEGYEVIVAEDGEEAHDRLDDSPSDLVLLDLMLPKLDGFAVLKAIRKRNPTLPVLILSAKGLEEEKVAGLRAGADDYLAKPFGLRELLARVEALLRRSRGGEDPIEIGTIRIDPMARKVFREDAEVTLSRKELEVLVFLARHRNRVVSRHEILDAVWGYFAASSERTVDFHILNLRRKLEEDPGQPRLIVTRHGLGFQLVDGEG
jgi:DNA-binding response OmpR family regulator